MILTGMRGNVDCGDAEWDSKVEMGRDSEKLAAAYLEAEFGLKFVESNWYCSHKEIDLVMEDEAHLRIVEVRSLSDGQGYEPYESIGRKKRMRLMKAAAAYAAMKNTSKEVVFDVVSIVRHGSSAEIEYIPDAYQPEW